MSHAAFVIIMSISFLGYFLVSWRAGKINAEKIFQIDGEVGELTRLNYKHAAGIFFFSVLPLIMLRKEKSLFWDFSLPGNMWNLAGFGVLILLVAIAAMHLVRQKKKKFIFPKTGPSPTSLFASYILLRALFLVSYEIFFRGFLLFGCILWLGLVSALVLNIVLYMLMHAFTDWAEILACIPFGLAVCWMTLSFKSIWPAAFLHVELSMIYEISLYRHYLNKKGFAT